MSTALLSANMEYKRIGWEERDAIWDRLKRDLPDHFDYDNIMSHLVGKTSYVYGAYEQESKKLVGLLFGVNYSTFGYVMSVSVAKENRGSKIATRLLDLFLKEFAVRPIWAKIHQENNASISLFRAFGFLKKPKRDYPLRKTYKDGYSPYRLE